MVIVPRPRARHCYGRGGADLLDVIRGSCAARKQIGDGGFYLVFRNCATVCLDLPGGHPAASAAVAQARSRADQAAAQPRPARRSGRLARALAGPCAAALAARRDSGVRRQSRRDRAGRVGLSGRGHGANGGEFCRRRRRHQSAGAHRRRALAGHSAGARSADRGFHRTAGDERAGIHRRGDDRLPGGRAANAI